MSSFGDLNRVNTNIQSMNAQFSLNRINRDLAQNQLMLATGLRINRAEDDAAGFSMAMTFRARTGGLTEALGNVGDAKGMLDVAEANFDAIFDNLLEMKALATRAGTDSMGEKERADLGAQIAALGQDINEISDQTVYQDKSLLNGDPLTGNAGQTFNFLVGERAQDLVTVTLDRVDMNELFRGSSALQNVSSTTLTDFGMTGGDAATHIAIKVGSTMSSEKHIIKLVDDLSHAGFTGRRIAGSLPDSEANGIRDYYGEKFLDTLIAQIDAKNIDGVWGEKVQTTEAVTGEYSFTFTQDMLDDLLLIPNVLTESSAGGIRIGGLIASITARDENGATDATGSIHIGGVNTGVTVGALTTDIVSEAIVYGINDPNLKDSDKKFPEWGSVPGISDYTGWEATRDGSTITVSQSIGAPLTSDRLSIVDDTSDPDSVVASFVDFQVLTERVQPEWEFVLHNSNTEEVSFQLLHTAAESASTTYTLVGTTNQNVAAAEDPNNRLEFDQRGSGADGIWSAADFRSFLADVDAAIVEMTKRVNDVGIAQSSLTKREETLSQSISSNYSAISRIMDTDFARVQSDSIRLQILQQTATVSLAQANFGPQSVLGFLG